MVAEGRRNVHAFVIGTPTRRAGVATVPFSYNPYSDSSFVVLPSRNPVCSAAVVRLRFEGGSPRCFLRPVSTDVPQ